MFDAEHPKVGYQQAFHVYYIFLNKIIKIHIWMLHWPMV